MARKAFFGERSVREIKQLNVRRIYTLRNLVRAILDLDPSQDSLELRTQITPGRFRANTQNSTEASKKCYKHGDLIALSQPLTQQDAYSSRDIPLAIRAIEFDKLKRMREEEISFIGYSFFPVQGRDRRKRVIPFVWVLEGERLFGYSENITEIKVRPYQEAERAVREGAEIVCSVPSRTKKKPRYRVKLSHVPVVINSEGNAIAYSLKSDFEVSPEARTYGDIRYTWRDERETSDRFVFYPQDIAAYLAIIRDFTRGHNLAPLTFSPIALTSRQETDFYTRLCNNIIIYDPGLSSKDKLRKLHIDEKSILIARSIGVLGHDETMYWDPERDGRIKDYNWKS